MFGDLSQQTFDLLSKADLSSLNKTTISQATISGAPGNLNAFDLRGPALQLYPVITPTFARSDTNQKLCPLNFKSSAPMNSSALALKTILTWTKAKRPWS